MRTPATIISQIQALIPNPAPPEISVNMTILQAELAILERTAHYTPPEATNIWERLAAALYRYMPNIGAYPWAKQISDLVTSK